MSDVLKRPRAHLLAMIAATVIYITALPFSVMAAMFSPMASDSGISTGVWVIIYSLLTLPVAIVAALILGWIFFILRMPRAMWVAILFPMLWIFPLVFAPFPHH
jgi:hypothetical protein